MTTPSDDVPALVLEDVCRIHQDGPTTITALDHVNLTVMPGELVAVIRLRQNHLAEHRWHA